MQLIPVLLSSWGGDPSPTATVRLLAIWLGPAVVAAVATSWLSGRRGGGIGRGIGIGVAAALVGGIFGCAVPPTMFAAPLIGAVAAIVAVLRS